MRIGIYFSSTVANDHFLLSLGGLILFIFPCNLLVQVSAFDVKQFTTLSGAKHNALLFFGHLASIHPISCNCGLGVPQHTHLCSPGLWGTPTAFPHTKDHSMRWPVLRAPAHSSKVLWLAKSSELANHKQWDTMRPHDDFWERDSLALGADLERTERLEQRLRVAAAWSPSWHHRTWARSSTGQWVGRAQNLGSPTETYPWTFQRAAKSPLSSRENFATKSHTCYLELTPETCDIYRSRHLWYLQALFFAH